MVSAKTIVIVLGLALFFVAGGGSLLRPAFATAKEDITSLTSGVREQIQNIKAKTEAGRTGLTPKIWI